MGSSINVYKEIREFLIENSDAIQKLATEHHKKFIGGKKIRSEILNKYQDNHNQVVSQLAKYLHENDLNKGLTVLKKLGKKLANDSLKDGLCIEEAVDGIIFLKHAMWDRLKKSGLINKLGVEDFYKINRVVGIYIDTISSIIAFTYHSHYIAETTKAIEHRKQLERQKDEFMGIVSHELKTPVTSIKAFTQILQHRFAKAGDFNSTTLLGKMDAQINKLTVLISDLLDVTKIEGGKLQFHEDYFSFDELVNEIVEEMQRITSRHKIEIRGATGKTIFGDRDRIGQVLTNILTNAIKYSPRSNKIIINLTSNKNSVALCVRDFGIGIPKEKQEHVFERFYRVSGDREITIPGIGLGMFIASEIIKRQKGDMWLESEVGKGSTFCFSLPIRKGGSHTKLDRALTEEVIKHE